MRIFHGTNRAFASFDRSRARTTLNDGYWTPGGPASTCLFFTTDERAGWDYAGAARNDRLDREEALAAVADCLPELPAACQLFADLIDEGREVAWERYLALSPSGRFTDHPEAAKLEMSDIALDDIADLADLIEGSRAAAPSDEVGDTLALLTGGRGGGLNDHDVRLALRFGIDCRPRLIRAVLVGEPPAEAANREDAERLLAAGAQAVRIPGDPLTVRRADEVLVADMTALTIAGSAYQGLWHDQAYTLLGNLDHPLLLGQTAGEAWRRGAMPEGALFDPDSVLAALEAMPAGGRMVLAKTGRRGGVTALSLVERDGDGWNEVPQTFPRGLAVREATPTCAPFP